MKEEIVIETERLYLRKCIPEKDAPFFVELMNSPGWLKYIGDRNIRTAEQAENYLHERVMKGYAEHGYGGYVLIEKLSGATIGNCGLFKRPVLDFPDIGYSLHPDHERKGFAYEASHAVMQYARGLNLKKVHAITVAYNERSIHLLTKLGLKFEKKFRMEGDPEELCLYTIELE